MTGSSISAAKVDPPGSIEKREGQKNTQIPQDYPGWSPRGNQRWTALSHSFDVFQRWFREHDKHQRWSALF